MLVAIQFPGDFRIPDGGKIEVVDFEPRFARCSLTVNAIAVPVYNITVIEIFISQQVKGMTADLFCMPHDLFRLVRKPVSQKRYEDRYLCGSEEESPLLCNLGV